MRTRTKIYKTGSKEEPNDSGSKPKILDTETGQRKVEARVMFGDIREMVG